MGQGASTAVAEGDVSQGEAFGFAFLGGEAEFADQHGKEKGTGN